MPEAQMTGAASTTQNAIAHYQLDFMSNANHHYYIWRHYPPETAAPNSVGILIDLNHVYVPNHEIEKMVFSFVIPAAGVASIAFANCHAHNQQEIKRKLKASDVKLFSKTAFFTDIPKAKSWLEAQCASC